MVKKNIEKSPEIFIDICHIIESSRRKAAVSVNCEMTMMYWHIGKRIRDEVLCEKRAEYGKQVVASLAERLTENYRKGWSEQLLWHCLRFNETFLDEKILYTLCIELSWSHFRILMFIDEKLKRDFYIEMCRLEHWSVRQLSERVNSMLYERTAISKKPERAISHDIELLHKERNLTTSMIFRDPIILDFLGLRDTYSENDLESAILNHLQSFIMELGNDFAFLARQKRITIDHEDYYIDLLFYHRKLRRLIAVELKLGKFRVEHKSQLELYLRWLDKYERQKGEGRPLGILLCAEKSENLIELLEVGKSGIHVAQYLTELPEKKLLEARLRESIVLAKERFDKKGGGGGKE